MEDIELRQMFSKIFEDLHSVKTDVASVKIDLNSVKTDVASVRTDLNSVKTDVNSVRTDLNKQGIVINKQAIIIESMQADIKTIVEVQKTHMAQNEREHKEMIKHMDERTGLLETALKTVLSKVQQHDEEITALKKKDWLKSPTPSGCHCNFLVPKNIVMRHTQRQTAGKYNFAGSLLPGSAGGVGCVNAILKAVA